MSMKLFPIWLNWSHWSLIRHSRLPAGNALWFCQNYFFLFFFHFFFLLPPPRFPDDNFWPPSRTAPEFKPVTGHGHRKKCIVFRMITFDPQAGPLQNLNWSQVMVIGRSVSFSDPARPPGGAPQTPQNPPPPPPEKKRKKTRNIEKNKLVGKKT